MDIMFPTVAAAAALVLCIMTRIAPPAPRRKGDLTHLVVQIHGSLPFSSNCVTLG